MTSADETVLIIRIRTQLSMRSEPIREFVVYPPYIG